MTVPSPVSDNIPDNRLRQRKHGADSFCLLFSLPPSPHFLYLVKPLGYIPKASYQGLVLIWPLLPPQAVHQGPALKVLEDSN